MMPKEHDKEWISERNRRYRAEREAQEQETMERGEETIPLPGEFQALNPFKATDHLIGAAQVVIDLIFAEFDKPGASDEIADILMRIGALNSTITAARQLAGLAENRGAVHCPGCRCFEDDQAESTGRVSRPIDFLTGETITCIACRSGTLEMIDVGEKKMMKCNKCQLEIHEAD